MKGSSLAVVLVAMIGAASIASDVDISRLELMPEQACTVLFATDGESSFGGNNEDFLNPLTKAWFIPGANGGYGRVYFGFEDLHAQGGMNDQGLFFDGLSIDQPCAVDTRGKEPYPGNLVDKILCECATVDCAIEQFERYYGSEVWFWQFMFGDATGVSAIVESSAVLRQEGSYQVATNTRQSTTTQEQALRTDWRYREATHRLEAANAVGLDMMTDALDAVHTAGGVNTLYSNVYDLNERVVYLYYFHDFDHAAMIDLAAEWERGFHIVDIASLFPPNPEAAAWSAPLLADRTELIESIVDPDLVGDALDVYVGRYQMPEGWGDPEDAVQVVAGDRSIILRFPSFRQFELHPISATDFAYVGFARSQFAVMMTVRFGFGVDGETEYLELVIGEEVTRSARR